MMQSRQVTIMRWMFCVSGLISILTGSTCQAQQAKPNLPTVVERVDFDWNHSGDPTAFILSSQNSPDDPSGPNSLRIQPKHGRGRIFHNHDDVWDFIPKGKLKQLNLLPASKRMLFVSAGVTPNAPVYLILIGAGFGCCVGSLDVLTAGQGGIAQSVFHADEHLLEEVIPLEDHTGIELIGQPSDSEARALENAQSYDPYRAYVIREAQPAEYNLGLSKAYTEAHYCEWHGPRYDERFVAVGEPKGARNCRTMSDARFQRFVLKHPKLFPEP